MSDVRTRPLHLQLDPPVPQKTKNPYNVALGALDAAKAKRAVGRVAKRQEFFTTDDVWQELGASPEEPRALGAIMQEAQRLGIIVATSRYAPSTRKECHRRPVRVWASLVRG